MMSIKKTPQEYNTLWGTVTDIGEELHWAVGDIAYTVFVQVITGVVTPVIIIELIVIHIVIISHIEGVVQEIIIPEIVLIAPSSDTDSPTVLTEDIFRCTSYGYSSPH